MQMKAFVFNFTTSSSHTALTLARKLDSTEHEEITSKSSQNEMIIMSLYTTRNC